MIAACVVLALAPAARAQSASDAATRRELLRQAEGADEAGDHARALDLAARAGRIEMTPSVRMFIAQQHEALGQLAEAFDAAEQCVHDVDAAPPALHNRAAIRAACRDRAARLRARLGRVVVSAGREPPAGLEVAVAGHALNPAFYGVGYVVTPGSIEVTARAPGRAPFRAVVSVAAGAQVDVPLALRPAPGGARAVRAARGEDAAVRTDARRDRLATGGEVRGGGGGGGVGPGPFVVMGLGVAGFALAGVSFALRNGAVARLEAACDAPDALACPRTTATQQAFGDALLFNTMTNAALIAGGVLVGAGAVWWLVAAVTRGRARPAATRGGPAVTRVPFARVASGAVVLGVGGTL